MKVKYFMWPYQPHVQGCASGAAERVLQTLDKRFEPRLFLVGLLEEEKPGRLPICVVPDDCPFQPDLFTTVSQRAELLYQADPDANTFHTHPIAHQRHLERMQTNALMRAISEAVEGHLESDGMVGFCGAPTLVEGYRVFPAIQVQRFVYDSCYQLYKGERDRFAIEKGLVDATIGELLRAFGRRLCEPEPGAGLLNLDTEELLRSAGRNVMTSVAFITGEVSGLFPACDAISTLRYEGKAGVGTLVLAPKDHPDIRMELELTTPVSIHDYGAIRKLLQLAASKLSLISDSDKVLGLGHMRDGYDSSREDLFVVRFKSQFVWELLHAGQTMLHVRFGVPCLKAPGFDRPRFERDLHRVIPNVGTDMAKRLTDLSACVASQPHGAMLVISAHAKDEADRLQKQASPVKPFRMTEDNLPWVTAIDGAVLCDIEGDCHAVGVILDGKASQRCSPTRGARYNSAVRYVEGAPQSIALVKSEDGQVDILPNLRPQLRKRELEDRCDELRSLLEQEVVGWKAFHSLMSWFQDHRFYLQASVCDEVNSLRSQAEAKLEGKGEPARIRIVYQDFQPHPDMNDSYLLAD
jgi:hypothetical protein